MPRKSETPAAGGEFDRRRPQRERGSITEIGDSFGAEEHSPAALVQNAIRYEEAGLRFALTFDHHPW